MSRIIYSNEAFKNLISIEEYYTQEVGIDLAYKVVDSIQDAIERLADYPESGSVTPSERLNRQGYKKLVAGRYVVIYKYEMEEDTVYVDYVYRETRNY